ncbi:30S ribosomal protein S19 [Candidatus Shikimatogenerans bostrichidophilus]|uniref:30S ribosomal protein S19 n=1 Tax=Candidatus Shikimatogenerans bostrichidophilus TaxID=2943807 RepID=UPI002965EA16
MPRSLKKGPYIYYKLLKKIKKNNLEKKKIYIKTWSRSSVIIPEFIGNTILVHNGKMFILVFIKEEMVGYKLGEFAPTRNFKCHSGKKDKNSRTTRGDKKNNKKLGIIK